MSYFLGSKRSSPKPSKNNSRESSPEKPSRRPFSSRYPETDYSPTRKSPQKDTPKPSKNNSRETSPDKPSKRPFTSRYPQNDYPKSSPSRKSPQRDTASPKPRETSPEKLTTRSPTKLKSPDRVSPTRKSPLRDITTSPAKSPRDTNKSPVDTNTVTDRLYRGKSKSPTKDSPIKSPTKDSPIKSPTKDSPIKPTPDVDADDLGVQTSKVEVTKRKTSGGILKNARRPSEDIVRPSTMVTDLDSNVTITITEDQTDFTSKITQRPSSLELDSKNRSTDFIENEKVKSTQSPGKSPKGRAPLKRKDTYEDKCAELLGLLPKTGETVNNGNVVIEKISATVDSKVPKEVLTEIVKTTEVSYKPVTLDSMCVERSSENIKIVEDKVREDIDRLDTKNVTTTQKVENNIRPSSRASPERTVKNIPKEEKPVVTESSTTVTEKITIEIDASDKTKKNLAKKPSPSPRTSPERSVKSFNDEKTNRETQKIVKETVKVEIDTIPTKQTNKPRASPEKSPKEKIRTETVKVEIDKIPTQQINKPRASAEKSPKEKISTVEEVISFVFPTKKNEINEFIAQEIEDNYKTNVASVNTTEVNIATLNIDTKKSNLKNSTPIESPSKITSDFISKECWTTEDSETRTYEINDSSEESDTFATIDTDEIITVKKTTVLKPRIKHDIIRDAGVNLIQKLPEPKSPKKSTEPARKPLPKQQSAKELATKKISESKVSVGPKTQFSLIRNERIQGKKEVQKPAVEKIPEKKPIVKQNSAKDLKPGKVSTPTKAPEVKKTVSPVKQASPAKSVPKKLVETKPLPRRHTEDVLKTTKPSLATNNRSSSSKITMKTTTVKEREIRPAAKPLEKDNSKINKIDIESKYVLGKGDTSIDTMGIKTFLKSIRYQ